MMNGNFGMLNLRSELEGFEPFCAVKTPHSMYDNGIFIKIFKEYFKFSNQAFNILLEPEYIRVYLDKSGKRIALKKSNATDASALYVTHEKKSKVCNLVHCVTLANSLHEIFGDVTVLYGHHYGDAAGENNLIIFTLDDRL